MVSQLNSVKLKMNADTNVSLQNTQGSPKSCFSKKSFEKKENIKVLEKNKKIVNKVSSSEESALFLIKQHFHEQHQVEIGKKLSKS